MFSVKQILEGCGARIANSDEDRISGLVSSLKVEQVAPLGSAGPSDLAFFFSRNYEDELKTTRAGVILTGDAFVEPLKKSGLPQWKTSVFLASSDPYVAMAKISREFSRIRSAHDHQVPGKEGSIHPTAVIDPSVTLGARVRIGAHVVVEAGSVIGDDGVLYPSVYVGPDCRVGNQSVLFPRVSLYQGTVIGNRKM